MSRCLRTPQREWTTPVVSPSQKVTGEIVRQQTCAEAFRLDDDSCTGRLGLSKKAILIRTTRTPVSAVAVGSDHPVAAEGLAGPPLRKLAYFEVPTSMNQHLRMQ